LGGGERLGGTADGRSEGGVLTPLYLIINVQIYINKMGGFAPICRRVPATLLGWRVSARSRAGLSSGGLAICKSGRYCLHNIYGLLRDT
jgi:hypothetical protein